jgi:urease subunit beta
MAEVRGIRGRAMATDPTKAVHPQPGHENVPHKMVPPIGGYVLKDEPIELSPGRPRTTLKARNTGDRPIQVGSHFHFFEVNRYLEFDRRAAFGQRLDIPANTAVRFEPGDEKEVTLVPLGGKRFANGFNNLVDGWTGDGPHPDYRPNLDAAMELARKRGFKIGTPPDPAPAAPAKPASK